MRGILLVLVLLVLAEAPPGILSSRSLTVSISPAADPRDSDTYPPLPLFPLFHLSVVSLHLPALVASGFSGGDREIMLLALTPATAVITEPGISPSLLSHCSASART